MVSTNKIFLTNQSLANQFAKYFFKGLISPINFLKLSSNKRLNEFGINYVKIFGIFGLITYPLYYLIWILANPVGYENFSMRILASILCIPLIFHKKWPIWLRSYLGIYWFIVLGYCLPFFFTILLLKNNFSYAESLNILAALTLLILLVDTIPLLILLGIAIPMGYLYINLISYSHHLNPNYINILISYLSVVIVSIIFPRKKVITVKLTKTNINQISSIITNIKKYFSNFFNTKHLIKIRRQLPYTRVGTYENLLGTCDDIAQVASTAINLLFINSPQVFDKNTFTTFPMKYCINEVLRRHPVIGSKIELNVREDILIYGNELLIMHVLYNLLITPLHPRNENKKLKTLMWTESEVDFNVLHIKHTIDRFIKENLSSKKRQEDNFREKNEKTLDLSFCKAAMEPLQGKILYHSVKGEYTKFELWFPTVIEDVLKLKFN